MEKEISIKKGFNLPYTGNAKLEIVDNKKPSKIALKPSEFRGIKPKLLVKEGESVRKGQSLFVNKNDPETAFVSPVSGVVENIQYGDRRRLDQIEISVDSGKDSGQVALMDLNPDTDSREKIVQWIKNSGLAIFFRQRPLNCIPDLSRAPKSIFINAMATEPGAMDQDFVLKGKEDILQNAINLLSKLTTGKIFICYGGKSSFEVNWSNLKNVNPTRFSGPHPSGLVSTHIHFLDPINKGETVWYFKAVDLLNIGNSIAGKVFDGTRYFAVTGNSLKNPVHIKSIQGASISGLLENQLDTNDIEKSRFISGTILYGDTVKYDGYMNALDSTLQVIPEGKDRKFMGWAGPGFSGYSIVSRCFPTAFNPGYKPAWNTNINGGHRAIVQTDVYDEVMPMDILTNFLVKAVLAEDIEEAEKLGILEVDPEDFALATFLCPSKTNISQIIDQGLRLIEKEGY